MYKLIVFIILSFGILSTSGVSSFRVSSKQSHSISNEKYPEDESRYLNEISRSIQSQWKEDRSSSLPTSKKIRSQEHQESSTDDLGEKCKQLEKKITEEEQRQQVAEKDHLIMQKWLVDNINDLHRELKQTETDFEHYVQVTKKMMAQNEFHMMQQMLATIPLGTPNLAAYHLGRLIRASTHEKWMQIH